MKLGDLGERKILSDIIPRFVRGSGDDCAIIGKLEGSLVITTDPVPSPAARMIGGDDDLFWLGWLLVTINASDIAAAGACPSSFVAALDLPTTLEVSALERLLEGIAASCKANGLTYVGGNLREADKVAAVGTAVGSTSVEPLTRKGARPGDRLVVIGNAGHFWADCERIRMGMTVSKQTSPVFSPVSQARYIWQANEKKLIRCAMDTSDGLAPSLTELSQVNRLGIDIDLPLIRAASDFPGVDIRSERLWMGWGDWTVVAAVDPQNLEVLTEMLSNLGSVATPIGTFLPGEKVRLNDGQHSMDMERLESERFAKDSWFAAGIDAYVKLLKDFPLP